MQILRLFFLVLVLGCVFDGQAQIKFNNIYTNNGYDFGEGVTQLRDSSYLVTGSSSSFGDAPAQAFLLHVDSMGNYLWSRDYGGTESDWGRRVFAVEGDGIYVAGYTNSFGNGSFDYYFFKTDMGGNLLFEKTYGGSKFEKLHGAAMLPDTTFILVGETMSNDTEVEDMYIVRLKSNGDTIWTKKMGTTGKDMARNITLMSDTTVLIVGDYYVADSLMQKAFAMKMHKDGTVNWMNIVGAKGNFSLNDVAFDGSVFRAVGYNKVTNGNGVELCHPFRYIANANGINMFQLIDNLSAYSRIDYLTSYGTADKFYVVEQALITNTPVYGDGEDCLIQRYSNYLFWDNAMLNTSNLGQDQGSQIIRTSDGGAIVVGYNTSYGGGGNNVTLVKIGPNDDYPASHTAPHENHLVSTEEIEPELHLLVYPNPVKDVLHIEIDVQGNNSMILMDAFGKVLQEKSFDLNAEIHFDGYAIGVYFVKIEVGGKQKVVKVVRN